MKGSKLSGLIAVLVLVLLATFIGLGIREEIELEQGKKATAFPEPGAYQAAMSEIAKEIPPYGNSYVLSKCEVERTEEEVDAALTALQPKLGTTYYAPPTTMLVIHKATIGVGEREREIRYVFLTVPYTREIYAREPDTGKVNSWTVGDSLVIPIQVKDDHAVLPSYFYPVPLESLTSQMNPLRESSSGKTVDGSWWQNVNGAQFQLVSAEKEDNYCRGLEDHHPYRLKLGWRLKNVGTLYDPVLNRLITRGAQN